MELDRLEKQISFIVEIDKLKHIVRQTLLVDSSRQENSSEHSWHIAVMAILLGEYSRDSHTDLLRVLKMCLIHDLVEIDAGDTYCYDEEGNEGKGKRERKAADRLFAILPPGQSQEFRELWEEFEARGTPEALFAAALDRLQPLLHNWRTEGGMWRRHGVRKHQVISRNRHIEEGAPMLWEYARNLIDKATERGFLME